MDTHLQKLLREYDADPQDIEAAGRVIRTMRRIINHDPEIVYVARNLPCDVTTDEKLWAISGRGPTGSGVLEWCYNQKDAEIILSKMQMDRRYSALRAHKWQMETPATPPTPSGYTGPIPWDELSPEEWEENYG